MKWKVGWGALAHFYTSYMLLTQRYHPSSHWHRNLIKNENGWKRKRRSMAGWWFLIRLWLKFWIIKLILGGDWYWMGDMLEIWYRSWSRIWSTDRLDWYWTDIVIYSHEHIQVLSTWNSTAAFCRTTLAVCTRPRFMLDGLIHWCQWQWYRV